MTGKSRKAALVEGILAGLLFGTAAVIIRLLPGLDAFSIALWRLAIASVALVLVILILRKKFNLHLVLSNFKQLALLGVLLGAHFMLFISAVKGTTILNATVLVNTTPIFSMILSASLYRIKPSRIAVISISVSIFGAGLIAYGDASGEARGNLMGDMAAILAAVAGGIYLNYGRERRRQLPLMSTMLLIYVAAAFTVGATTIMSSKAFGIPGSLETLLLLVGLGIFPTATAHTLYFSSLSNLKSFETATMALLEPLGATLIGIAIFAEIPTTTLILGAALVLTGVFSVIASE